MELLPLLFGDATRVQVLRLLAREPAGLTRLAIAKRLGRSASHIGKVVEGLRGLGVVALERDRRVRLEPESPLYTAVVETLERFAPFEEWGRLLRTVIRAANERFDGRYYVGGYLAAVRSLQPIDFRSDRCDLYVKGLRPRDGEWGRTLRRASPYDVRLHDTKRLSGYVDADSTVDDEPCLVAYAEVGAFQCLQDDRFPRYGAFLLLVQGIDEWNRGDEGYEPQRLANMAAEGAWTSAQPIGAFEMRALIKFVEDRLRGGSPKALAFLTKPDQRELENALNTVAGA